MVWALLLATLLLTCSRAWAYVVMLALLELAWVAACFVCFRAGLLTTSLTSVFWALAWLVFAAVELALVALVAISYAQSTGQSTLV